VADGKDKAMADMQALVATLKERRIELGMSQRELGARSGIGKNLVCAYETGRTASPTGLKLLAWADALGCDAVIAVRQDVT
jgi:transcriptional regulator with XRE-family HTH domain